MIPATRIVSGVTAATIAIHAVTSPAGAVATVMIVIAARAATAVAAVLGAVENYATVAVDQFRSSGELCQLLELFRSEAMIVIVVPAMLVGFAQVDARAGLAWCCVASPSRSSR